jgi:Mrp family chromosome partitioning ATPase
MTDVEAATRRSRPRQRGRSSAADDGALSITDDHGDQLFRASTSVSSSVRYLLARIQLNDAAGLPQRLGVTSALRGEGVTFVSRTIAAVIAHDLNRRCCLVDLNWGHPTNYESATRDSSGIAEVVNTGLSLDDVLIATAEPNLMIMPAGNVSVAQRPVLAKSDRLAEVIDELAEHFDHLVLDLPAVLATSDALALALLCDAYALVVHQGVTTQDQVLDAFDELRGVVNLGIILNRESSRIPKFLRRLVGV